MNLSGEGALVGLAVAGGVLLITSWWIERRPLSLTDRIGPFLSRPSEAPRPNRPVRRRRGDPTVTLGAVVKAAVALSAPDDPGLSALLRRAGWEADRTRHRRRRVASASVGALLGLLTGAALTATPSVGALLALSGAGGAAGWWAADALLRRAGRRRQRRMAAQVPMLADLLALAVGSGAAPLRALESAARAYPGPLSDEVLSAVAEVQGGRPAGRALADLAEATGLPELARLLDTLLLAVELGTPLSEVARAQAADVRVAAQRRLVESAGRREVAMLVPIVLLVLPSVVAVALFPAISELQILVP